MTSILDVSDEISVMLRRIAAAMEEQSATVKEINSNMEAVKQVAQSNAAASEEITATVVESSKLTTGVRNRVNQFRLMG